MLTAIAKEEFSYVLLYTQLMFCFSLLIYPSLLWDRARGWAGLSNLLQKFNFKSCVTAICLKFDQVTSVSSMLYVRRHCQMITKLSCMQA